MLIAALGADYDEALAATGRKQEPFVYGSLPGEDFYFAARGLTRPPTEKTTLLAARMDTWGQARV